MADQPATYDLTLLLSTEASEEQRAKVLNDVESTITAAGGSIERNDDWGRRPMTYQIRHQPEAEYHLLQFRAPGELIAELSHTLGITDGVLRRRIIKVRSGTPPAPSSPPPLVGVAAAPAAAPATAAPAAAQASPPAEDAAPDEEASRPAEDAAPAEAGAPAGADAPAGQDEAPVPAAESPEADE